MFATAGETPVRLTIPAADGGSGASTSIDNVRASFVTASYFPVLGLRPALGRFYTEDEDRVPNSAETQGTVVVLSDGFWERQFGRDPGVLDRTIIVSRSSCRVIGVAPRGFTGEVLAGAPDPWVPLIARFNIVSAGYFETIGIQLAEGRAIDARDTARTTAVAVINEAMARRYFPSGSPIGRQLEMQLPAIKEKAVPTLGRPIGLPLAWISTRAIGAFLYGLSPTDPTTIAAATLTLLAVAGAAAYLPARRATRVDPLIALRYD